MRLHFVTAVDTFSEFHKIIYSILENSGHEVITDHYVVRKLDEINNEKAEDAAEYYKNSRNWISKADILIFDVTKPDTSVGFELATAFNQLKPVIVLFHEGMGFSPHGLRGIQSEKFQLIAYTEQTLRDSLIDAISIAEAEVNIRFNLMISSQMNAYLEKESKRLSKTKSSFVRDLVVTYKKVNQ